MQNLTQYLSDHALMRSQQRGIKPEAIKFIMQEADRSAHTRCGRVAKFITKKRISSFLRSKILKPSFAESLKDVVIIASGNQVLTVYHNKGRKLRN